MLRPAAAPRRRWALTFTDEPAGPPQGRIPSSAQHEACLMSTTEIFLIAIVIVFTVPCLVWRLVYTDYYAPLVVVVQRAGGAVSERHRVVGGDGVRAGRRHRARPEAGLGTPPRRPCRGQTGVGMA